MPGSMVGLQVGRSGRWRFDPAVTAMGWSAGIGQGISANGMAASRGAFPSAAANMASPRVREGRSDSSWASMTSMQASNAPRLCARNPCELRAQAVADESLQRGFVVAQVQITAHDCTGSRPEVRQEGYLLLQLVDSGH